MSFEAARPRESTRQYWERVSPSYPFHAETDGKQPRPDKVKSATYGDFIACPIREIGCVWWGFKTKEGRDLFAKDYNVHRYDVRGQ